MSFFGHLLAGAVGGAADGYSAGLAQQEKADLQRQMQEQRVQSMLDRQQMQNDFRLQLEQDKADRKGGGGGNGSGRDMLGDVLDFMKKGDQEGLNKYIDAVSAFDATAADQLRSTLLKKQPVTADMTASWPTEKDVLASMGDPAAMVPEVPKNASRGEKERVLGEQALTKLAVIFRDPAKLDTYAKGERQMGLNQFGAEIAGQTMGSGGTLENAAAKFSQYSATKDDTTKNDLAQARLDLLNDKEKRLLGQEQSKIDSREIIAKQKALIDAQKLKIDPLDKTGAAAKDAAVKKLSGELDAMVKAREAGSNQPSTAPAAPFTKSALPPPKQAANRSYPPRG